MYCILQYTFKKYSIVEIAVQYHLHINLVPYDAQVLLCARQLVRLVVICDAEFLFLVNHVM